YTVRCRPGYRDQDCSGHDRGHSSDVLLGSTPHSGWQGSEKIWQSKRAALDGIPSHLFLSIPPSLSYHPSVVSWLAAASRRGIDSHPWFEWSDTCRWSGNRRWTRCTRPLHT